MARKSKRAKVIDSERETVMEGGSGEEADRDRESDDNGDDDAFTDDDLPSMGGDHDPELPRGPVRGGDPDASEFRDALNATPNVLGVQSLLEQEADLQQQEQERATMDALEAMRALDHSETVKWRITRTGCDDDVYNGFLATWPNSQMSIERLKRHMGGGTYYLKGFRNGRYFTHKAVNIAGPPILKPGETPTAGSSSSSFDVQSFLAQQQAHDERRRREEEERYERRRKERMEMIAVLGPVLAPVLAALVGNRGPDLGALLTALKPPPPPDPIQQLAALKALVPEPAQPASSPLETAFALVEKLKDLGGLNGSEGQAGWMDVFKEVVKAAGPSVGSVIEGAVQNAQAAAAARHQAAPGRNLQEGSISVISQPVDTSQPTAPRLVQEGQPVLGLLKHLPFLRSHLNRWVLAAQKSAPPGLYAQVFFTEAPDDLDPRELMELLQKEDWLQQLTRLDARIAQVQPWFHELHAILVHTLETEYLNVGGAGMVAPTSVGGGTPPTAAVSAPSTVRRVVSGEVERPMKLPSMTGD
jgi:hypothetical protein